MPPQLTGAGNAVRILARQTQNELAHPALHGRPAWTPLWLRPLPAHELSVPASVPTKRRQLMPQNE